MKTFRILVALPEPLKKKLDAERRQGTTASGPDPAFARAAFQGQEGGITHNSQPGGRT